MFLSFLLFVLIVVIVVGKAYCKTSQYHRSIELNKVVKKTYFYISDPEGKKEENAICMSALKNRNIVLGSTVVNLILSVCSCLVFLLPCFKRILWFKNEYVEESCFSFSDFSLQ